MTNLIRPATPGFIVTLAATVILAVVSFSVPLIKSVYFLKASLAVENENGDITFGTLGYCASVSSSTTCSNATVGYQLDINALIGDTTVEIPQVVVKWLTYVLVLHIVAFGLAAISALFGLLAHVREMAMSCFSSFISGFAAVVTLAAFIFDIAIFFVAKSRMNSVQGGSASIGNAVWLTLAAFVLLFFSGCFYSIGRCCIRRRSRDAWGGKVGTAIGENGYDSNEQMRLDAVKAEVDRKARQAQPEVGLPAFHEYDPSQPLKARVDGDEAYLEEDAPYRDNQSVSTAGNAGTGTYGRSRGGYVGGGYVQAPLGTRAVDEYNNRSPYSPTPKRRGSNITHSTTTTAPSVYPPSSTGSAPLVPATTAYDHSPANHYNHDPYSPQAYGHNTGGTYNLGVQPPHTSHDAYGGFSPDAYNATAAMAHNSSQPPYAVPRNPSRSPTLQADHGYAPGGGTYGVTTAPAAPANDPYSDPYYGQYRAPSNPTPPPTSRSPPSIDTRAITLPTPASPIRGPKGPRNNIIMSPQSTSPGQYTDNPPTYESSPSRAPSQWGNRG